MEKVQSAQGDAQFAVERLWKTQTERTAAHCENSQTQLLQAG